MELVDEADLDAADRRPLGVGEAAGRPPADDDVAAVRTLEQAGDVEERRLAGAGRRDQRDQSRPG